MDLNLSKPEYLSIRVFDVVLPLFFVLTSLAVYVHRRYTSYYQIPRIDISDADFLRLPTQKVHTLRSLAHLAGVLTQIGTWGFIFAWRLESAILDHHRQNPSQDAPIPLYQIICPALSMLSWVSSVPWVENPSKIVGWEALWVIWSFRG